MRFSLYFASHTHGSQAALEKAAAKFTDAFPAYSLTCEIRKVYETEAGEIFLANVSCPEDIEADEKDKEKLARKLMAAGLEGRFIPLDQNGHEIFLTPEYGFDVILYSQTPGREPALRELVIRLANEIPGHEGRFNIQTHMPDDEPGEYYYVSIRMQDYWTPEARGRLMLAFYFRLLCQGKLLDFEPVDAGGQRR